MKSHASDIIQKGIKMIDHPKLFISYSHDCQEHKNWVCKLATDLRQHSGVDVIFDQWNLRIGGDLSLYIEQGLSDATLVLCVCSDSYVDKANSGSGGSGYEKMIMTRSLLKNTNIDYLIPVIRANSREDKLPTFLGTKLYIDFSNDDDYISKLSDLVARIYNEDIAKKPPLGTNPFSKAHADFVDIKNSIEQVKYHNPQMNGKVVFNFSNNSKKFVIGTGEYEFITSWSECGSNSIYAYRDAVKDIGYMSRYTDFPAFADLNQFDYTSRVRTVYIDEIVVWVNRFGHFAATKIISIKNKDRGADEDELTFEYKIYC